MDEIFVTRAVLARGLTISENRVAVLVHAGTLPTPKTKGHFPLLESVRRYVVMLRSTEHSLQAERAQLVAAKVRKEEFLQQAREGHYVEARGVEQFMFRTARLLRNTLHNIPDRLAGPLAAEHDQAKVHTLMRTEIHQALTDLETTFAERVNVYGNDTPADVSPSSSGWRSHLTQGIGYCGGSNGPAHR